MTTKEELKTLPKQLRDNGDVAGVKEKAGEFLKTVDAKTLSIAEQELLQEGFDQADLIKLCDVHLAVMGDTLVEQQPEASLSHPVGIFMAEHQVILRNLAELAEIVNRVGEVRDYAEIQPQIKRLGEIAALLLETESHHQREEQVLFPRLERHGVTGPPRIMKLEHDELRARKRQLNALVKAAATTPYADFADGVREAGGYLAENLKGHIFKEDNILYPTALQTLSADEWQEVIAEFDKIGYCSFTPGK